MRKFEKIIFPVFSAALLGVLSLSEIYNMRPFGTGAFIAFTMTPIPVYITAPAYFVFSALTCTRTSEVLGYAVITVLASAVNLICARFKKQVPLFAGALIAAVGYLGFIYAAIEGALTFLGVILTALFSLLFMLVLSVFLKPVLGKGTLTEIEMTCGCVVLAAASLALARPVYGGFTLLYAVAAFVTLLFLYLKGSGAASIVAVSVGAGGALYGMDYFPIAVLALSCVIASIFRGGHRALAAAGYILGFTMSVFLLGRGEPLMPVSAAIGAAAFMLIPKKALSALRTDLGGRQALIDIYNAERRRAGESLSTAAEIFAQMSRMSGDMPAATVDYDGYARRLIGEVCTVCPKRENCPCVDVGIMERLVREAIERGHTSVNGLPSEVLEHCSYMNRLVDKTNGYVESAGADKASANAFTKAARLLSGQLRGSKELLQRLSQSLCDTSEFDYAGGDKFKEELLYSGCECKDCLIGSTGGEITASALVVKHTLDTSRAEKILEKIYKRPFFFVTESDCENALSCARFKSGTLLDVVFGVSNVSKDPTGVSGDTHAFTRIGTSGFMMALSDGMGSGKAASEISTGAIELVEKYYKAGFSSDFVVPSVNRFLALRGGESFSALDVLVIDLESGKGDVIKIGSPDTVIKRGDKVAFVGGGSLPLGAVEDMTPYVKAVEFEEGDMIVMVSDGVADAFGVGDEARLISSLSTLNPQTLSQFLLDKALMSYGGAARDDMTVLCARIYRK